MKDKEKFTYHCYLAASICFFLSAGINIFSNGTRFMSGTQFCLGAAFLCLASTHKKEEKEEK